MRWITCEDCKKRYDYDKDEFCPKCGAFNQPVKTWTTDAQGNVRRVDGLNEANHEGSFAHSEVHREKRVRQAKGLDASKKAAPKPKSAVQQPRPAAQPSRPPIQRKEPRQKKSGSTENVAKVIFWIVAAIIFVNFILPLLAFLFI